MFEIRLHGIGGEGVVRLSEIIGKTATLCDKWAHSFPFFGTEIRGAAVKAFTRVDDAPISIKSYIYEPDAIIVTNDVLLENADTILGLTENTILIVNTSKPKEDLNRTFNCKVYPINATALAYEIIGKPIANTVMLGAFIGATEVLPLEQAIETVRQEFNEKVANLNIDALKRGYEDIKKVI